MDPRSLLFAISEPQGDPLYLIRFTALRPSPGLYISFAVQNPKSRTFYHYLEIITIDFDIFSSIFCFNSKQHRKELVFCHYKQAKCLQFPSGAAGKALCCSHVSAAHHDREGRNLSRLLSPRPRQHIQNDADNHSQSQRLGDVVSPCENVS